MDNKIVKAEGSLPDARQKAIQKQTTELAVSPAVGVLETVVKTKAEMAKTTIEEAAQAVCTMEAAQGALSKDVRYVVDMSDTAKQALRSGAIKFDINDKGEMFAQIRKANGQFGEKFPIKEELAAKGIDPLQMQVAMQVQAIQDQLREIMDVLQGIEEIVSEIKQGQHGDRLGLCHSGRLLFLESLEVSDKTLRSLLESQALKSLSDGAGQLMQEIAVNVRYLAEGKYKSKKGGQKAAIAERLAEIRASLDAVNASVAIKAAIYYNEGETGALARTLETYAEFINGSIAQWAGTLAELDESEKLPKGGFWEQKAQSLQEAARIRGLLDGSTEYEAVLMLESSEEADDAEQG